MEHHHADATHPDQRRAMRLSLIFGVLMLAGKCGAWWVTGSAAILSDALESVVHVAAVGFAAFSLWLSHRPADSGFLYGYERIAFFSAGFEGGMIVIAALAIIYEAAAQWVKGIHLQQLGLGTGVVAAAAALNAGLGLYLVRIGKRERSIILEANGKHVLTDSYTSAGVIVGLLLVMMTGIKEFDPICAILVALNILWSGGELIWRSARGLMDYADPDTGARLRKRLDELGVPWHGLRYRATGNRLLVEVHLLFPFQMPLGEAHERATLIEDDLEKLFEEAVEVTTHLEAVEDHGAVHKIRTNH